MKEDDIYLKIFGFASTTTYYSWKKDPKRKIFKFIKKYFTKEDLEEFLETGKINKLEKINKLSDIENLVYNLYFDFYSNLKFSDLCIYFKFLNFVVTEIDKIKDDMVNSGGYMDFHREVGLKNIIRNLSYEFYQEKYKYTGFITILEKIFKLDYLVLDYILLCYNSDFTHNSITDEYYLPTGILKVDDYVIYLHHQVYFNLSKKKDFEILNDTYMIANIYNNLDWNIENIWEITSKYKKALENLIEDIKNNNLSSDTIKNDNYDYYISLIEKKINFLIENKSFISLLYDGEVYYIEYTSFIEYYPIEDYDINNFNKIELLNEYIGNEKKYK